MKTTPEVEAEIVRLHYAEHWPVGTIATQLEQHVDVVKRVLGLGVPRPPSSMKPRLVDPYREYIDDTLRRYPKLLATRLYDMLVERAKLSRIAVGAVSYLDLVDARTCPARRAAVYGLRYSGRTQRVLDAVERAGREHPDCFNEEALRTIYKQIQRNVAKPED